MHLVDAIRLAAQKNQTGHSQPEPAVSVATTKAASEAAKDMEKPTNPATNEINEPPIPGNSDVREPLPVSSVVPASGGSVVRLELFLTPEQMNQMLRGILTGTHTVMTLREAAQYLRVSNDTLTKMAESGEIAAFMVEGRWKFPRHSVDEWMTLQTLQMRVQPGGTEENAA